MIDAKTTPRGLSSMVRYSKVVVPGVSRNALFWISFRLFLRLTIDLHFATRLFLPAVVLSLVLLLLLLWRSLLILSLILF